MPINFTPRAVPVVPFHKWSFPAARRLQDLVMPYLPGYARITPQTHHILSVLNVTANKSFTGSITNWTVLFSFETSTSQAKSKKTRVQAILTHAEMSKLLVYLGLKHAPDAIGMQISFPRAKRLGQEKSQTSVELFRIYLNTWYEAKDFLV